jgi:ABC-2 type transport system ATP-binding protein
MTDPGFVRSVLCMTTMTKADRVGEHRIDDGPAIVARQLRMSYGRHEAVRGIDLTVHRGEVFAFLGPNGAGKTTTVEMLEGFRTRTGGDVDVLGTDPARAGTDWRERVGVVLQSCRPEPDLTVRETVDLYGGLYARPLPTEVVLALTGLEGQAQVRNQRLSGGQQRRLDVALALVGNPELLFLDEPTTGFDPAARRAAWEVIAGLKRLGKTVFLTTHYLEEAEVLADRLAVIVDGRIVAEGTPTEVAGRDRRPTVVLFAPPPGVSARDLPAELAGSARMIDDGRVRLASSSPVDDLLHLTWWATQGRHQLERLEVHPPTLEETYLDLIDGGTNP